MGCGKDLAEGEKVPVIKEIAKVKTNISETWLNDTILHSELLQGFNIFRRDRKDKIGGGVLIATKDCLQATRRCDLERDEIVLVVVQLRKTNNKSVILYSYYRPPGTGSMALKLLNDSLPSNPGSSCIVVVGDFNVPLVSWSDNQSTPINRDGYAVCEDLSELIGDNFMEQLVEGPTHRAGSKLDLLLCNCPDMISDVLASSPDKQIFPTDHFIIEFSIRTKFSRAKPVRRNIFSYNHVNFPELCRALSQADFNVVITNDIEQSWKQ